MGGMTARLETRQHPADSEASEDWRNEVTLSVPDAGRVLGVGRNCAYGAAQTGEIPTIKIGARLVVPVAALRRKLGEIA
jgi:hypothetical protein